MLLFKVILLQTYISKFYSLSRHSGATQSITGYNGLSASAVKETTSISLVLVTAGFWHFVLTLQWKFYILI